MFTRESRHGVCGDPPAAVDLEAIMFIELSNGVGKPCQDQFRA
jgi:hypothetical protein